MNVDLEIYINNLTKFFKKNPKELMSLVPKEKEKELLSRIRQRAARNIEEGLNLVLTQKQIIEICVDINQDRPKELDFDSKIFQNTPFGTICLN
jgi:sugar-specific transcriptional regulator TrmB